MPVEASKELIDTIRQIPLFADLTVAQVRKLLALCQSRTYQAEEKLCLRDTSNGEMYILITGELAVVTEEGGHIDTVKPVSTVGEIGLITGRSWVAAIEATQPSEVIVLEKAQFDQAVRQERGLKVKTYHNLIDMLSQKLWEDNVRMRDHVWEKKRYKKLLGEERGKLNLALDLLVERAGMQREQAMAVIIDRLMDVPPLVLVVDDQSAIRELFRKGLSDLAVVEAADGLEAVEQIEDELPDLVITDLRMPNMDGYQLMAYIEEYHPELPVLAISGYVDAEEVKGRGFVGFLKKPISFEDVKKAVQEILRREERISA